MDDKVRASVEGTWVRQLLLLVAVAFFAWQGFEGLTVAYGFALMSAAFVDWRGFFGIG